VVLCDTAFWSICNFLKMSVFVCNCVSKKELNEYEYRFDYVFSENDYLEAVEILLGN